MIMKNRLMVAAIAIMMSGCGLLDVTDPTAIEETDIATNSGADFLRADAVRRIYGAVQDVVLTTGLLTDELFGRSGDRREGGVESGLYTRLQEVRRATAIAIPAIEGRANASVKGPWLAEMFAVRGYTTLNLAEVFCAGFPLHDVVDFVPVYGDPLTTEEVFARARADFDSAAAHVGDNARIRNLTAVGLGRALLGLGKFAEAGQVVQSVPTEFVWEAEYSEALFPQRNFLGYLWSTNSPPGVGDKKGQNGLDFVSANDPRLPTQPSIHPFYTTLYGRQLYAAEKYTSYDSPIVIASGIEARLIEAEAALRAGDARWLNILNELRATRVNPGMPPLEDPGTNPSRVDLLFRERAFWLFATGHRLGDFRRLMAHYGRDSETLFPVGPYESAGFVYETATSFDFPAEQERTYNPAITGCTG